MPASSPIWKGQLRLSLVFIAVELYTSTKSNAAAAKTASKPETKATASKSAAPRKKAS